MSNKLGWIVGGYLAFCAGVYLYVATQQKPCKCADHGSLKTPGIFPVVPDYDVPGVNLVR